MVDHLILIEFTIHSKTIFLNMLSNINNSLLSPLEFEIFKFLTIDKTVPCLLLAARALVLHFRVL